MTTVKQIHNAFYKEVCEPPTEKQSLALQKAGFDLMPPQEYTKLFPHHKLIHENRILLLCEKYNLLFSGTDRFSGVIPNKNLIELQEFIEKYDYVNTYKTWFSGFFDPEYYTEYGNLKKRENIGDQLKYNAVSSIYQWSIVAPKEMVVTNKTIEEKNVSSGYVDSWQNPDCDPIIIGMIMPKMCSMAKWGVIVTAWGDEASDELVVNEKMN